MKTSPKCLFSISELAQYQKVIPIKLVKEILALEYIDIAELQSEHWDDYDETETTRSSQWTPVSNIPTWLDCYAPLVSVLCSAHSEKFGQSIINAHRRYTGDVWVIYDSSYHCQAANMTSLD